MYCSVYVIVATQAILDCNNELLSRSWSNTGKHAGANTGKKNHAGYNNKENHAGATTGKKPHLSGRTKHQLLGGSPPTGKSMHLLGRNLHLLGSAPHIVLHSLARSAHLKAIPLVVLNSLLIRKQTAQRCISEAANASKVFSEGW